MPGLAPAGDSLFFASPKKSKQKKSEPKSGPLLRCSALPHGLNNQQPVQEAPQRFPAGFGAFGFWYPPPLCGGE